MKTIYVNISSSDLKTLVNYVSDKNRTKSELTEIIMNAPEVFGKSLLNEKSIFSVKKGMLDTLAVCKPNVQAAPVATKSASKPVEKTAPKVEKTAPAATEIDFQIMASAIRQICQSNLTPDERVKLIDALLAGETTKTAPKVEKTASKPAIKPATKVATKPAKKESAGTPKKSDIMLDFILAQKGEYFSIDEVVAELNKYYEDEKSNKLTAGAFVTAKLAQKGYEVERVRQNGTSWYSVAC